jgi:hypothetical protein
MVIAGTRPGLQDFRMTGFQDGRISGWQDGGL